MKKFVEKIQSIDNEVLGCVVMLGAMTLSYILGVRHGRRMK